MASVDYCGGLHAPLFNSQRLTPYSMNLTDDEEKTIKHALIFFALKLETKGGDNSERYENEQRAKELRDLAQRFA